MTHAPPLRRDPIAVPTESTVVVEYVCVTSEARLVANLSTQVEDV